MNRQSLVRSYKRMVLGALNSKARSVIFAVLALMILIMSWEASMADAAIIEQSIPQESIRLRILANSDSPGDQLLKRQVRDKVVAQMNAWVQVPDGIEEAREIVTTNMPILEKLVADTILEHGYQYSSSVQLGIVDFPTKLYGNEVYPAGKYEALRITIGKAEGQNWWCVLFPPLCFVDMVSGQSEAVATDDPAAYGELMNIASDGTSSAAGEDTEVRFFLWDLLQSVVDWIGSLF